MNLARGGALTALALLVAVGCGGSDAPAIDAEDDSDGGAKVLGPEVPDAGGPDAQPLPEPPPPPVGKPVEGVFVSSSKGADDTDGTRNRPLKTLAAAIKLATEKKGVLPVIACAETFTEAVKLGDGITMYGNFDCTDPEWKTTTARAKIDSPTSPALLADGLKLPVRFEGFEVIAPDMTGTPAPGVPAASSYGAIIKGTKGLTVSDVRVRAGAAQAGVDGAEPPQGNAELGSPNGLRAYGPTKKVCTTLGGLGGLKVCNFDDVVGVGGLIAETEGSAGGTSSCRVGSSGGGGGKGGGGRVADSGTHRSPFNVSSTRGLPWAATAATAAGGNSAMRSGTNGAPGPQGSIGANGQWAFGDGGFVPGDGVSGGPGVPGQGGGGGSGIATFPPIIGPNGLPIGEAVPGDGTYRTGIGAGGGAGGCGGVAGTAGSSGGASVGLLVVGGENVKFTASRIEAADGGRAGRGSIGTAGISGGTGGAVTEASSGWAGGAGGAGGAAGLSGNGAAGPSIALAYRGTRPTIEKVELVPGKGGATAPAITGNGQTLPASVGEAKAEHGF